MPAPIIDRPVESPFRPHTAEIHQAVSLGTGVFTPYIPPGATCIIVQATAQNIRYTMNGTTPTASVGFQLIAAASPVQIDITEHTKLLFFREASGAILQYEIGE